MSEGIIIVNATALDKGGALRILEQFFEALPTSKYEYIVFVNSGVKLNVIKVNAVIEFRQISKMWHRFLWDTFGVAQWIKEHDLRPVATLSLQNTNFRTKRSIPNFIYFHNFVTLSDVKWNPLKRDERILWFYKHIYPFFIRIYLNKKTEIFVQASFIKESFSRRFRISPEKIHIVRPEFVPFAKTFKQSGNINLDKSKLNLFYPATPYLFKNHTIIFEAISSLEKEMQKQICLHLTCKEEELGLSKISGNILFQVHFMGWVDSSIVKQMYLESDALLFPSFIETVGLPLMEAASVGQKIIVSDLPFAQEILSGYDGASFIPYNNSFKWKIEIIKLFNQKGKRYRPMDTLTTNSWTVLFNVIERAAKLFTETSLRLEK
jgi:glycosyltransferase involved in cell wall biosynthesis